MTVVAFTKVPVTVAPETNVVPITLIPVAFVNLPVLPLTTKPES